MGWFSKIKRTTTGHVKSAATKAYNAAGGRKLLKRALKTAAATGGTYLGGPMGGMAAHKLVEEVV